MREINPDSPEWREYLEHALMAQFVEIPKPQEPLPWDGMEEGNE